MSVFCPHIAITSDANLELPVGFKPDDIDVLVKATPDQRAVVINTGCVALRKLLENKEELSEDQAFKKGKDGKEEGIAAELARSQREKKTLEAEKDIQLNEITNLMQKCEIAKIEPNEAQAEPKALRESEFETIKKNRIKVEDGKDQKTQNAAWKLFKNQIIAVIDNFQDRMKYVMKDGNDSEEDNDVEIEEAQPAAACNIATSNYRKTHRTPVNKPTKAKKARNSNSPSKENEITRYFKKIPKDASKHQDGKDALSEHNDELFQHFPNKIFP
ncbi:hypothetical protein GHT06_015624 [Daphnia sinensis]|uniref:Uncharacterized protein n=1 Tax=Daphnia sinensis TaxID=1820382 RepID=A0AAD5LA36_9CRUS|nr:hypothetical protein GHT06_015624 [Daphnia sinensis]